MAQNDTKKSSGGLMALAIPMLLVCVMGFGLGIGMRVMNGSPSASEPEAETAENHSEKDSVAKDNHGKDTGHSEGEASSETAGDDSKPDNLAEMVVEPLAPVITNVANPKSVWVRLEGSILIKTGSETSPKVLSAQAGQQVMAYLRSVDLKQVEGTSGLFHVTEDLNEVMRSFSGGQVRQILISGFVVE